MSRILRIPDEMYFEFIDESEYLTVPFSEATVAEWCLELTILRYGLSDAITIETRGPSIKLKIRQRDDDSSTRASVEHWKHDKVQIAVSPSEVEYWLSSYLKLYRDGSAQVDHIDIELQAESEADLNIILTMPSTSSPVSEREARRRLGL